VGTAEVVDISCNRPVSFECRRRVPDAMVKEVQSAVLAVAVAVLVSTWAM